MRRLLISFLLFAAACGDTPTGITAGDLMSVADQLAIEPALGKVAQRIEEGGTQEDQILADLTRVAARLVRLQGRAGAISVSGFPTGASSGELQAVSVVTRDGSGAAAEKVQVIVAWEGLHNTEFTVQRALIFVATAGTSDQGEFPVLGGAASGARVVDYSTDAGGRVASGSAGTITIAAPAFRGDCPGLPNSAEVTCETGRQTAAASVTTVAGPGESGTVTWAASVLPAFRLTLH